jgi:ABC-type multidrug transport system fused ATPase/permease subunit
VINNGEIVEQGSHDQLLAAQGFYYQLYVSQFKGLAI